jgi:hypothetical protein
VLGVVQSVPFRYRTKAAPPKGAGLSAASEARE